MFSFFQQNKVKARPRVSPGPSSIVQGQVRPTLVGVGQKIERQTQTLTIQQKPQRMPTLIKPTTVAQKLAGTSVSSQPRPQLKPVLSLSHPKPTTNVNIVAPELVKQAPTNRIQVSPKTSVCATSKPSTAAVYKPPPTINTSTANATPLPNGNTVNNGDNSSTDNETAAVPPNLEAIVNKTNNANKFSVEPKEKQLQKAIVKPNILTHVIEGFVILEASEPFPVSIALFSVLEKGSQ